MLTHQIQKIGGRVDESALVITFCLNQTIFCQQFGRKKVIRGNAWTTEGLSSFEHGGGPMIVKLAEERKEEDLARRIRGKDLFACEAKYHKACRVKYCDRGKWRSPDPLKKEQAQNMDETHSNCFNKLCKAIDKNILLNKEIMKMTDLRDLYVEYLSETLFANPNYKTQKLKCRLVNDDVYRTKSAFIGLGRSGGKLQTDLVFSTETSLAEAVRSGYLLGCTDKIDDTGILLRNIIKDTFEEADELPWPPTASYLQTVENPIPIELQRCLRTLISGHGSSVGSEKLERLVSSIVQDLYRAVTNGQWKLPKHIMVCMALRHLYRSAQLNTLMNKLGHAESYSFGLELETAVATALEEASSLLTPQIIRNSFVPSLFHSDFENFIST